MKQNFFNICSKTGWLCLESGFFILLILFAATGVLIWKTSQGPVDLEFARETIELALRDEERGLYTSLEKVQLYWPDRQGPLLIGLRNVEIVQAGAEGSSITVEEMDLDLSYRSLVLGQIQPVSLILRQPSVSLIRQNGDIDLFVGTRQIGEEDQEEDTIEDLRTKISDFVRMVAEPQTQQIPLLSRLESIRIDNAGGMIRDYDKGLTWRLSDLDFAIHNNDENTRLDLGITLPQEEDKRSALNISVIYRKLQEDFTLNANLVDLNPVFFSKLLTQDTQNEITLDLPISGQLMAGFDSNLSLQQANLSLETQDGTLFYPDQFIAPVAISDFALTASYDEADKTATLSDVAFTLNDIGFNGSASVDFTDLKNLSAPVTLNAAEIPQSGIEPLFPAFERNGDAGEWLIDKMSGGVFKDVKLTSTLQLAQEDTQNWSIGSQGTRIDFTFEDVDVNYSPPMTPALKTKGSGFFDLDSERLEVDGTYAEIGDVIATKSKLIFTDIMISGGGYADLTFEASGPLKTALEFVADEPVDMREDLGFDIAGAQGKIDFTTNIKFPTLKDLPKDEVFVTIDATLDDVLLPGVVEGLDLSGGPYTLTVAEGQYNVKGSGQLDGSPITLDWTQYFDPDGKEFDYKVTAQLAASEKLRDHFNIDLQDYISGDVSVDLTLVEKPNGDATIDLKGDLNPTQIHIKPFAYTKASGVNGTVSLRALLPKGRLTEIQNLNLSTTGFSLDKARLGFEPRGNKESELMRGKIEKAVIGQTEAVVDFEVEQSGLWKILAKGELVDASPFIDPAKRQPADETADKAPPMHIAVEAGEMITKNDRRVQDVKLYLETDADNDITQIEIDARAGLGDIYIRFKPDAAGKRIFRLEADDAGAALYAADMYDNVRGGTLLIYGEPKGADMKGNLFGVARMENFNVVNAPALAQLLNAMSLGGMLQQLQGEQGLAFSKLESDFEWRFRTGGNLLVIEDGRTSGSSIGLTFEGTLDQQKEFTDIQGTIVPMSGINSFIGSIPLVGDILTGGGALIAATYTFRGPMDEPQVAVNPLSVLTPGIIRRVLFEGGFDSTVPDRAEE